MMLPWSSSSCSFVDLVTKEELFDGKRRKGGRDIAESERRLCGTPEIESWRRLTSTRFEDHPYLIICMYLPKRWALIAAILTRYPQVAVSPASNRQLMGFRVSRLERYSVPPLRSALFGKCETLLPP
jgi:hypothetical protein